MYYNTSASRDSLFGQDKDKKINSFLQAVPYLSFSDTGLKNIASRFGISIEDLKQRITDFEAREGQKDA